MYLYNNQTVSLMHRPFVVPALPWWFLELLGVFCECQINDLSLRAMFLNEEAQGWLGPGPCTRYGKERSECYRSCTINCDELHTYYTYLETFYVRTYTRIMVRTSSHHVQLSSYKYVD